MNARSNSQKLVQLRQLGDQFPDSGPVLLLHVGTVVAVAGRDRVNVTRCSVQHASEWPLMNSVPLSESIQGLGTGRHR